MLLRRKLLIALLSFALTPMVVMGAWVYMNAQKAIETTKIAELESTANLKVQKIEEFFKERKKDIILVQNNTIIKKNVASLINHSHHPDTIEYLRLKSEIDDVLKIKNKIFQYKINIIITDLHGRIIYSLEKSNNLNITEKMIQADYQQPFKNGFKDVHFSDVFITDSNRICMLLMLPALNNESRKSGIIAFEVEMNTLFDFIQDTVALGKTGETIIAKQDEKGVLFLSNLRHDPKGEYRKKVMSGEKAAFPVRAALEGINGLGLSKDYRGEKVLAVWRSLPMLTWGLVTKIDASEAFKAVYNLKRIVFIIGVISIVSSIIIAFLFSNSLTKPIAILKQGVESFGRGGDLGDIALDRKDEIGVLANAFSNMAKNLKIITASRDELDKEVAYRKRAEAQIKHLNQVLQTIRMVNKHITTVKDAEELIKGVCQIITENRGYHNAWIILTDEHGKSVSYSESNHGKDMMNVGRTLLHGKLPACSSLSIKSIGLLSIEDPETACTDCPLVEKCAGKCLATIKLEYDGKVYGLLTASIPKNISMNKEEQELFLELAKEIAYSLNKLEIAAEREQSELARKRSEKQFKDLVENSPTGISIIQDGKIVYQNPEQEKLLGPLPRPTLFSDYSKIHPDDLEKIKIFNDRLFSKETKNATIEYRFYPDHSPQDNAKVKWVHVNASWIEFQRKESILINILDISKTKELEKIIRTQDKMSSLGRVAAGIAHEIRNPLSGINIYLDTLRKSIGNSDSLEKQEKIIDRSKDASKKIETIIKRVMDFSKPGEPTFVLSDINRPIEEAIHLSSVTLRKTKIQLSENLDKHLPHCLIDAHMIEQVMLNIITNAIEAIKDKKDNKKIEISSFLEGNHICITISDTGPGVPNSIKNNIFEPFYTTKRSGSGIGLAICHRIIDDHGGVLSVSSNKTSGAEFKIQIPITLQASSIQVFEKHPQ